MITEIQCPTFAPDRLRRIRKEIGLSQLAVYRSSGVSPHQMTRFENGNSIPSLRSLCALAATFGVPIGEFFDDDIR